LAACADEMPPAPGALAIEPRVGPDDRSTSVLVSGEFTALHVAVDWGGGSEVEEASATLGGEPLGEIGSVGSSSIRGTVPILPIGPQRLDLADAFGRSASLEDAYCVLSPAAQIRTLAIAGAAGARSGEPLRLEMTARDERGAIVERFEGAVDLAGPFDERRVTFAGGTYAGDLVATSAGTSSVVAVVDLASDPCRTFVAPGGGSAKVLVEPGHPAALAIAQAPARAHAGECFPMRVEIRDAAGNTTPVGAVTPILVTSAPSTLEIFGDGSCASPGSPAIAAGESSVVLSARGFVAGAVTIAVSDPSAALAGDSAILTIEPGTIATMVFTSPPHTLVAGGCGTASVEWRDGFGNPVPLRALRFTPRSSGGRATFYADGTCTLLEPMPISMDGATGLTFAFTATVAGSVTLHVDMPAPATLTAAQTQTIVADVPAALAFETPPQTILRGACSTPIIVGLRDRFGNPALALADITLSFQTTGMISPDPSCLVTGFGVQVLGGEGSATVFLQPALASTGSTLELMVSSPPLVPASQVHTVVDTPPDRLELVSGGSGVAGTCVPLAVESRDSAGAPLPVVSPLTVSLLAFPSTRFRFFDAGCTTPITDVVIPAGDVGASLAYAAEVAGTVDLFASAPSYAGAILTETILPGPLDATRFASPPQTLAAGQCSAPFSLAAYDRFGNVTTMPVSIGVGLVAAPGWRFTFYSDPACTSVIDSVPFDVGQSKITFHAVGEIAASVLVTAAGVSGDTQIAIVLEGPPTRLSFVTPPRSAAAGVCSAELEIEAQDDFGNPSPVVADTGVLIVHSGFGGFDTFAEPACSVQSTMATILAGDTRTQFHFQGSTPGLIPITVMSPSLAAATQNGQVTGGDPTALAFVSAPQTLPIGACSAPVVVATVNAVGSVTPVLTDTLVTIGGPLLIFDDPSCTTIAVDRTIMAGQSSVTFYFAGAGAGVFPITADALGLLGSVQVETILATVCGDGLEDTAEACDDGNAVSGDGCSSTCTVEVGYVCVRYPSFCALEAQTAFVDDDCSPPGSGTNADPYCRVEDGVDSGFPNVIVRAGFYSESVVMTSGDRRIAAESGAVLSAQGGAEALGVTGSAILRLIGLELSGGSSETVDLDDGAMLILQDVRIGPSPAIGLHAQGQAHLIMDRTWIQGTEDALILADMTTWLLSNSILSQNSDDAIDIFSDGQGTSQITHLTIAGNGAAGADCRRPTVFSNTIVWDNGASWVGMCTFASSDVEGGAPGGNLDADPLFTADGTYHLSAGSPCIDEASLGTARDFDAQLRPIGLGSDIGADEAF
jgi:cysteine-rich repeat protein